MPKISALPLATSVTGDDLVAVVQGGVTKKATIDTLPVSDLVQTALDGKQPLDADLTAYANAADAAARRALISAETAGAADTVQGNLTTHESLTSAHGATSANTASRIVARSSAGVSSLSGVQLDTAATPADEVGLIRWNATDKTAEIVTEGGVVLQLGQEETVYVRNNSGVAIANGEAVYVTGATGQRPTIAKATGTSASGQKMMGLVTTDAGIANNAFGFVTINGIVHGLDTSAFTDGAELYLSPTTAGALTATAPIGDAQRIVRVGYVVHAHANQGMILVKTHYQGTPLGNSVMEAEGAAAARTALGLGTLATQSGTFSGTSSGTNTGDQTITLTGDVTGTGTGSFAATIANNAVTNEKAAQVATQTFKGRNTAETGNVEDLSVATVKTMLAVSNVDNTSDANKPVSTAQQTALNLKANLASPALTGTPTAPTAAALDNSTKLSTTAYADAADLAATAALIEREGLRFDGTAGAVIGNGGIPAVGTGDWSLTTYFRRTAGTYESIIGGSGNTVLAVRIFDTGVDVILQNSAQITFNGTVPASGVLAITKAAGYTTVSINGAQIDTAKEDSNNYATGESMLGLSYVGSTPYLINGALSHFDKWNYALTASEIATLQRRGLVTLPEQRGGSMVALNTSAFTERYDTGKISGSSATGFTMATTTGVAQSSPVFSARKGQSFRVTGLVSSLVTSTSVRLQMVSSAAPVDAGNMVTISNGQIDGVITFTKSVADAVLWIVPTDGGTWSGVVSSLVYIPLGTLFEMDSGRRHAGYMLGDTSGNKRHLELPTSGVSIIDPADTGFIEYTRTTDGWLIGDRRVIPAGAYLIEVVATGDGTVTLGESAGTPANVCASVTLTTTPKSLPILVTQTSTGKLYADLGTATTATFKIRHRS